MVVTKRLGVAAAIVSFAALASVGCSNSLTGTDTLRRHVQSKASHDSTAGGTCLSGFIIIDGIATCPGGH
jgi:hypothetical protein